MRDALATFPADEILVALVTDGGSPALFPAGDVSGLLEVGTIDETLPPNERNPMPIVWIILIILIVLLLLGGFGYSRR